MNGVLIIDKPAGLTSHDVVNRVRRILQERSVGHLGTLDPMATGVLPLVIGNLTRLAQFYTSSEKTYEGTIRFGFATDTYDAEGEPTQSSAGGYSVFGSGTATRPPISRHHRANAAAVLGQEDPRRARLQASSQTRRGHAKASSSKG